MTASRTSTPTCPFCGYSMTTDDMLSHKPEDLFALAPREDDAAVTCPSCDLAYWVRGGYTTHYTSAAAEEEL